MKIVVAEHFERRGKIFLEHVEQAIEIHVRINIDAIFRRQTIVAAHESIESAWGRRLSAASPSATPLGAVISR